MSVDTTGYDKPSLKRAGSPRRKAVEVSRHSLVTSEVLPTGKGAPLLIRPEVEDVNLVEWAADNQEFVEANLRRYGALLFRGFDVASATEFEEFVRAAAGELLTYHDQTSPRHEVGGRVYTSTDYPAGEEIFLHNESSYAAVWPLRIFFFCVTPAERGGETPIADVRSVFASIEPRVRERFERQGWMLVRNFGGGLGLPWQTVFQTENRAEVEDYCRGAGIEFEWREGGRLRTRQVRPAVAAHPETGEQVWFNHAVFFHLSTLEESIRESLASQFREEDLPYQTYYGDGSPIEASTVESVRQAYRDATIVFPWRKRDILMLDNMLMAHGRRPFEGPREVLVGMARPYGGARASRND